MRGEGRGGKGRGREGRKRKMYAYYMTLKSPELSGPGKVQFSAHAVF